MSELDKKPRKDIETRFKQKGKVAKAQSPISVRLPEDIDKIVRSLPNRSEWIAEAIEEKLAREQIAI
ncbi:MAG: ribbon-helix-helix domain-containing protein [Prochloraceae cyanobacterium]